MMHRLLIALAALVLVGGTALAQDTATESGVDALQERIDQLQAAPEGAAVASPDGSLATPGDGTFVINLRGADISTLAEQVSQAGFSVATIYGNLSPEVRQAQAEAFRSGQAQVLVATDAIGMGLNLPIRRVVFSALVKWDGRQERSLTPAEVRQIGGRAGRYGQHEEGVVSVLAGGGDPARLRELMATEPAPPADLRPQVSPDRRIVAAVAEAHGGAVSAHSTPGDGATFRITFPRNGGTPDD